MSNFRRPVSNTVLLYVPVVILVGGDGSGIESVDLVSHIPGVDRTKPEFVPVFAHTSTV
jgi:hypothetical protein